MKSNLVALFFAIIYLCSFAQSKFATSANPSEDFFRYIQAEVEAKENAMTVARFLQELKAMVSKIHLIRQIVPTDSDEKINVMDLLNEVDIGPICTGCEDTVNVLRKLADKSALVDLFEKVGEVVCEKFLNKTVCIDAVTSYGDIVFGALMNRTFNSHHVCEKLFLCPRTTHREHLKDYIKEVLKDKPATNIPTPTKKSTYTVLQLTDPHIDLQYQEGTNAFCTEPLCCRAESGAAPDNSKAAQYWGTLAECDVPLRTFEQFLQFVSQNFDVDIILWTGDNIAHDIWHQSIANQTVNTYVATQDIIKYFPNAYIYPMFGNHEAYPADQFDFFGNASAWLTERLSDMWKVWLDNETISFFRQTSYYSVVNQEHNLKIIALDMVACDSMDFYLIDDPTDPHNQLAWLRQELYDSENNNQTVFIMGHIPPGDFGCDSEWSARYRALVDRFTNIIRGQFFGHTHNDQLQIVRSYADNSPVGVAFIAPSFTTYSYLNPSFRIFEVDAETNQPIDYLQYRLDLGKWNQNTVGPIEWDMAYSVVEEYGLPDTTFKSFDDFVEKMKEDSDVAETYVFNFMSGGVEKSKVSPRNLQHYYCEAKHSVSENSFECLGLKANIGDLLSMAEQILPGAWKFDKC